MKRLAAIIATLLLVAACSSTASNTTAPAAASSAPASSAAPAAASSASGSAKSLPIGVLLPLSGGDASNGQDALHGMQLAADVLNGKDTVAGITPMTYGKLVLDSADTQSNPTTAVSDAQRLYSSNHVIAFVGAFESGVTAAASQETERLGIPWLSATSVASSLTQRGYKWFFRSGPSFSTEAATYFAFLKSLNGSEPLNPVVVVYQNDTFGDSLVSLMKSEASTNGLNVTDYISYPPNPTDLSSVVTRLKGDKPSIVFFYGTTPGSLLFVRTLKQLDYTPPAILTNGGGSSSPDLITSLGPLANDLIDREPWSPQLTQSNPMAATVAQLFQSTYNQPMDATAASAFTGIITLGQAIQAAGSTSPDAIRSAIAAYTTTKTIMPWQGVKFDSTGQNVDASAVVLQLINGKWQTIYPTSAAQTKVVWPMPSLSQR